MTEHRRGFENLHWVPNGLSWSRLGLAVVFPLAPRELWLFLFVVAAITEFLDGYLARRWHVESRFGQLLDPIADKAFLVSVAATLLWRAELAPGVLLWVGLRDVFVVGAAIVYASRGEHGKTRNLKARWFGKATTALQFALLLWLLAFGWLPFWLVVLTGVVGLIAIVDYVRSGLSAAPALAVDKDHNAQTPHDQDSNGQQQRT